MQYSFDVSHQLATNSRFIQILLFQSTQMGNDPVYSNPHLTVHHKSLNNSQDIVQRARHT